MKIKRPNDEELQKKAAALLFRAFNNSKYEEKLIDDLRLNDKEIFEWVAIHRNMVIGYIAFTHAYKDEEKVGLHLAPIAIHPEYQRQGIGTEMMNFALRQKEIKDKVIFVLGKPGFYQHFGFEKCQNPICDFTKDNKNFQVRGKLELGDETFSIDYEDEF